MKRPASDAVDSPHSPKQARTDEPQRSKHARFLSRWARKVADNTAAFIKDFHKSPEEQPSGSSSKSSTSPQGNQTESSSTTPSGEPGAMPVRNGSSAALISPASSLSSQGFESQPTSSQSTDEKVASDPPLPETSTSEAQCPDSIPTTGRCNEPPRVTLPPSPTSISSRSISPPPSKRKSTPLEPPISPRQSNPKQTTADNAPPSTPSIPTLSTPPPSRHAPSSVNTNGHSQVESTPQPPLSEAGPAVEANIEPSATTSASIPPSSRSGRNPLATQPIPTSVSRPRRSNPVAAKRDLSFSRSSRSQLVPSLPSRFSLTVSKPPTRSTGPVGLNGQWPAPSLSLISQPSLSTAGFVPIDSILSDDLRLKFQRAGLLTSVPVASKLTFESNSSLLGGPIRQIHPSRHGRHVTPYPKPSATPLHRACLRLNVNTNDGLFQQALHRSSLSQPMSRPTHSQPRGSPIQSANRDFAPTIDGPVRKSFNRPGVSLSSSSTMNKSSTPYPLPMPSTSKPQEQPSSVPSLRHDTLLLSDETSGPSPEHPSCSDSAPVQQGTSNPSSTMPSVSSSFASGPPLSDSALTTIQSDASKYSAHSSTIPPSSAQRKVLDAADVALSRDAYSSFHDGIPRKYQAREHIYAKAHKAALREDRTKYREELAKEIYNLKRSTGYTSDYSTFHGYLQYRAKLESLGRREIIPSSPSLIDLRSVNRASTDSQRRHSFSEDLNVDFLKRALQKARETLDGPSPPKPFVPSFDQLRLKIQEKDAAIEHRLRPKRRPAPSALPPEDEAAVNNFLAKKGVLSRFMREQVTDKDISRLKPRQWLNDEVLNFYGQLLMSRAETCKANSGGRDTTGGKPLNIHYFSTFFWAKLKSDGYEKGRLAKWTKKFDLFEKDIVLIPINHNNVHWTSAAINFRRKRVEAYDSMNMNQGEVYKQLRMYIDAEHRNKKKKPFDFTGWKDHTLPDTPQQENAYDCGVFTCQFLETLSRGEEEFSFRQQNIPHLRRKMIWEICNATLRDDP